MTRMDRRVAQDRILAAIVTAALAASEAHQNRIADAIKELGASIARRYGVTNVSGLPGTFAPSHRGEMIRPTRNPNT
jgi:hypothetical protein